MAATLNLALSRVPEHLAGGGGGSRGRSLNPSRSLHQRHHFGLLWLGSPKAQVLKWKCLDPKFLGAGLESLQQLGGSKKYQFSPKQGLLRPPRRRGLLRAGASAKGLTSSPPQVGNAPESDYEVRIDTSRAAGSGLSQPEGGVMVALLGSGGGFVLKKLDGQTGEVVESETLNASSLKGRFEVGASAQACFRGPSIGKVESIWLSPLDGTWGPASASVTVKAIGLGEAVGNTRQEVETMSNSFSSDGRESMQDGRASAERTKGAFMESNEESTMLYSFQWSEGLIGKGCELSAAQLVPVAIHIGEAASQVASVSGTTAEELAASRASGLVEYEELKAFLLGCTAALVGVGTFGSKLAFGDEIGIGFAAGGLAGLSYLLLLQRTVDQIGQGEGPDEGGSQSSPNVIDGASGHTSGHNESPLVDRILNRVAVIANGPASRMLIVALLVLVTVKVSGASETTNLEPRQILAGLAGFLVYKIAVLLAAFRPTNPSSTS